MGDSEGAIGLAANEVSKEKVTPDIAAEAAVWIARLHGPDRSHQMEREFREWQALSPTHRYAFERCTDTWLAVSGVTVSSYAGAVSAVAARKLRTAWRSPWRQGLAAMASAALLTVALVLEPWQTGDIYNTGIGEQRLVVLPDGTRMSLNTATRVRVALGASRRTVEVEHGEALFEVAKDSSRPFNVRAADSEVLATGTTFVVRLTPSSSKATDALDVTLVEGQVVVSRPVANGQAAPAQSITMAAGERLRLGPIDGPRAVAAPILSRSLQRDRPRLDQILAWKHGEAIFYNSSLNDAVFEMNRYSSTPIVLASDVGLADLRVSGVFKTGDSANFARAVSSLHDLAVLELPERLELSAK